VDYLAGMVQYMARRAKHNADPADDRATVRHQAWTGHEEEQSALWGLKSSEAEAGAKDAVEDSPQTPW